MKYVLATILILSVSFPAHRALAQPADRLDAQVFDAFAFRAVGPGLTTSRVSDVEVDPNDANTWYVAMSSSGLWKTENRGNTWSPIFDDGGSYSLGAVVVDPRNSNIVWLGTGENQSQRSVGFGDGLYKSTDAGATWQRVGLVNSEHIQRILIDPRNSNVVYVAAQGPLWNTGGDRGVYKTTDGGSTWNRVLHVSDDTGVTDLAFKPDNPDVLYASAYQRRRHVGQLIGGGPEAGIFKTTDAGANWQRIQNGLPTVHMGRIALGVDPRLPERVYAQVVAQDDAGGFFRTDDAGASWTRMNEDQGGDPQYYGEIFVDPHRPETVWTIAVQMRRTEDGGRTFQNVPLQGVHVDHHEIVFDPDDPDHMIIGNDGGLYETYDGARTFRHFTNLPIGQFYRLTPDQRRPFYHICGGLQDNGSICGPSRSQYRVGVRTSEWYNVGGGDGFQSRIDPADPNILYTQSQNGALNRLDLRTGQSVGIRPPRPEGEASRWHWDSPMIISPHAPNRLYFGGNRLWRSTDRGDSWVPVSPDLTRSLDRDTIPIMGRVWPGNAVSRNLYTTDLSVISALEESSVVEGLLYVGTDDGFVQVSEDAGANWRRIDAFPGLPPMSYVTDVTASPIDANTVFATFNNYQRGDFRPYVLKSTDRGRTWTSIAGNLPVRAGAWSIVQDHVNPDLLFIGMEFGVWFTTDGGTRWTQLGGGIPVIQARDVEIMRRESDLIVGSFGRGGYILDDYSALREVNATTLAEPARLFPLRDAYLYDELGQMRAAWGNMAMANPPFGAVLTVHVAQQPATAQSWSVVIRDAGGQQVRALDVPGTNGLYRIDWNLRADPPATEEGRGGGGRGAGGRGGRGGGRGGRGGQPQGPIVEPGTYTAQLARTQGTTAQPVGPVQTFRVTALPR